MLDLELKPGDETDRSRQKAKIKGYLFDSH